MSYDTVSQDRIVTFFIFHTHVVAHFLLFSIGISTYVYLTGLNTAHATD